MYQGARSRIEGTRTQLLPMLWLVAALEPNKPNDVTLLQSYSLALSSTLINYGSRASGLPDMALAGQGHVIK